MSDDNTAGRHFAVMMTPTAADARTIRELMAEVAELKAENARLRAQVAVLPAPGVDGWDKGES